MKACASAQELEVRVVRRRITGEHSDALVAPVWYYLRLPRVPSLALRVVLCVAHCAALLHRPPLDYLRQCFDRARRGATSLAATNLCHAHVTAAQSRRYIHGVNTSSAHTIYARAVGVHYRPRA